MITAAAPITLCSTFPRLPQAEVYKCVTIGVILLAMLGVGTGISGNGVLRCYSEEALPACKSQQKGHIVLKV